MPHLFTLLLSAFMAIASQAAISADSTKKPEFSHDGDAYVLIMLFGGTSHQSGYGVVNQEFKTREKCEIAMHAIAKAHNKDGYPKLHSQGCYEK